MRDNVMLYEMTFFHLDEIWCFKRYYLIHRFHKCYNEARTSFQIVREHFESFGKVLESF